jgi:hypothetical protein
MPLNRAQKPESYLKITSKTVSKMLKYSSKKKLFFLKITLGRSLFISNTTKVFNVIALDSEQPGPRNQSYSKKINYFGFSSK